MRNRISRDCRCIGRFGIYRGSFRNSVSAGISVLSGIYRLILLLQTSREGSPVFTGLPSNMD
ncbi:hypothetical protein HMPREF1145_0071 [Oribacterium parvum ACB8]|nr:hypothetical protein HMPREF1145_0071 [Oribacterium parvum ACB8]